ncbi:hypothetical protein FDP41_004294 [Naegleria fowleri]|uniref:Uncharacterized protein n=1 Tax=Naegleria fowleri TaxID=5763 RepID=A0A6A5BSI6_NAEFO|nr:uncharacterized protein FDP41_004294 [Naegleria fowleri]KAF0976395.1 hypothetical protein FDP41_004294 [Naegleria fowleri]
MSWEKHISFAETTTKSPQQTKNSNLFQQASKSPELKRHHSTASRKKRVSISNVSTANSGNPSSTDSKDSPLDATPTASPGLPSTSSVRVAQSTNQIPASSTLTVDNLSSFKSITTSSKVSSGDKGTQTLVEGERFEKDFSFPATSVPLDVVIVSKPIIDVEANNAKSSYHLALLITAMLSFFCLGFFSFIPFVVIYAKYHSSQSEKVQQYVSRSKWIILLILLGDLVLFLIAALVVVIVLFATGVFKALSK